MTVNRVSRLTPIAIYIDADACPVKQGIYRVAEGHALKAPPSKSSSSPTAPWLSRATRAIFLPAPYGVMAGLVPAIHVFLPGPA
jgi:hypothetical protein